MSDLASSELVIELPEVSSPPESINMTNTDVKYGCPTVLVLHNTNEPASGEPVVILDTSVTVDTKPAFPPSI